MAPDAKSEILALVPAHEGWWAGFVGPEISGHQSSGYHFARVALWAMVKRPSGEIECSPLCRCIAGNDGLAVAVDDPEYLGVIEPGEDMKVWMAKQDGWRGLYRRAETRARALLTGPSGLGGVRR